MRIGSKHLTSAFIWSLFGLFVSRGATTLFTLLLAKLLSPEAFGLIAMVTIVFELSNILVASGLGQAIIRAKEVTDNDLSTAFWANLLLSGVIYLILFFSASYISNFYHQPELIEIVRILGLVLFINAARIVSIAIYSREINFKIQVSANVLSIVISGSLAVLMAYLGAGVWSLVSQMLVSSLVISIILWCNCLWRPSFTFDNTSFLNLYRFGMHLTIESAMNCIYQNSYYLLVGYYFNAYITGLYFFAVKISNLVSQQITDAFQQVSYPAMSLIQDNNKELKANYRKIIRSLIFFIAPISLIAAGLSSVLFSILLDSKWHAASDYFRMLCLVAILYPLHSMNINVLNVKGRSDLVLKVGYIKITINLIVLFITIKHGVEAVIWGQIIGSVISLIPNCYYSKKLIGYGLRDQLLDVSKPIVASLIAGLCVFSLTLLLNFNQIIIFLISGTLGVIIYLIASYMIKSDGLHILISKLQDRSI